MEPLKPSFIYFLGLCPSTATTLSQVSLVLTIVVHLFFLVYFLLVQACILVLCALSTFSPETCVPYILVPLSKWDTSKLIDNIYEFESNWGLARKQHLRCSGEWVWSFLHESRKKHGGDWITEWFIGLCALLWEISRGLKKIITLAL